MEKNQTMTDEQLARELQNGKRGRGRGKLLTVVGCVVLAIGIFTSVTALTVIGIVVALLGQGVLNKHQKAAGKAVFESLVPEIMNANFEDVQPIGKQNLVDIKGSNIPLPSYVYDNASGRIDFTYRGLTSELCTVTLTDVDEYRNENNDMMESAERVVYTGQWMACELGKTYPAELMSSREPSSQTRAKATSRRAKKPAVSAVQRISAAPVPKRTSSSLTRVLTRCSSLPKRQARFLPSLRILKLGSRTCASLCLAR